MPERFAHSWTLPAAKEFAFLHAGRISEGAVDPRKGVLDHWVQSERTAPEWGVKFAMSPTAATTDKRSSRKNRRALIQLVEQVRPKRAMENWRPTFVGPIAISMDGRVLHRVPEVQLGRVSDPDLAHKIHAAFNPPAFESSAKAAELARHAFKALKTTAKA